MATNPKAIPVAVMYARMFALRLDWVRMAAAHPRRCDLGYSSGDDLQMSHPTNPRTMLREYSDIRAADFGLICWAA